MGGSAQTQVVSQSAPTGQTAGAAQASSQSGHGSSATAVAESTRDIAQTAEQVQVGGEEAQTQVIEQTVGPAGVLRQRLRRLIEATLRAGARQMAGCSHVLVPRPRAGRAGWRGRATRPAPQFGAARRRAPPRSAPATRSTEAADAAVAAAGPDSARRGPGGAPVDPLGLRGALDPALLDAPWWGRRQLPSAVRRLMGVVSRLERPG